jgi:tRNA(Ile)-lysidine synthase
LPIDLSPVRPGDRVAIAVSGGADSVSLLRALHAVAAEQGLVLRVAHFHHGLRGTEADGDAAFVKALAVELGLPVDVQSADTAEYAADHGQSIEQAARTLRYGFFRELLRSGAADVIATAHTQNDQAETVLLKFMRGGWTEGLGGIAPVLKEPSGRIVRPLLHVARAQVELYLAALGQAWREDSSNASADFTRNRVRAELLPLLQSFNPNIVEQLQRVAEIARDEELYWQAEVERALPTVLLPGKPVRGGGRRVGTGVDLECVALDLAKLCALPVALQRRLLRAAARKLNFRLEFEAVEQLRSLFGKKPGSRATLPRGLRAVRTARELHLSIAP